MKEYNITFDEGGKNERTMTFRYVPSKQQVQNMSGNFAYETTAKENFKVRSSSRQSPEWRRRVGKIRVRRENRTSSESMINKILTAIRCPFILKSR